MWIRVLRWVLLISLVQSASTEERIIVDELPTLEFLDYLGQLVETDGELVGPEDFDDMAETETVERDQWISRDQQEDIYRD